jgi:hypothetical protein
VKIIGSELAEHKLGLVDGSRGHMGQGWQSEAAVIYSSMEVTT